jgi:hypothetical protein
MIVRIIQRKWNDETKRPETVDYFNETFEGTKRQAHKSARRKYPLPEYTLGFVTEKLGA